MEILEVIFQLFGESPSIGVFIGMITKVNYFIFNLNIYNHNEIFKNI
jgi:hypothetical protein